VGLPALSITGRTGQDTLCACVIGAPILMAVVGCISAFLCAGLLEALDVWSDQLQILSNAY